MATVMWAVCSELTRDVGIGHHRVPAWEKKPIFVGNEAECFLLLADYHKQQDEARGNMALNPFLRTIIQATVYTVAKVEVTPL